MSGKRRGCIDEDSIQWIRDNLTEKQIERLTEVTFQWEGAAAMSAPRHRTAGIDRPATRGHRSVLRNSRTHEDRLLEGG